MGNDFLENEEKVFLAVGQTLPQISVSQRSSAVSALLTALPVEKHETKAAVKMESFA